MFGVTNIRYVSNEYNPTFVNVYAALINTCQMLLLFMNVDDNHYQLYTWLDVLNGGAGIAIYLHKGSTQTAIAATRRHYSNYNEELEALLKAISLDVDSKPKEHHDCISHRCVLGYTNPDQQHIATPSNALQLLSNYYNCRVAL